MSGDNIDHHVERTLSLSEPRLNNTINKMPYREELAKMFKTDDHKNGKAKHMNTALAAAGDVTSIPARSI